MKTCPICNKEIEGKNKYCNRICYNVALKKRFINMNISNIGKKWEDITSNEEKLLERKNKAKERMSLNNPTKKEEVKTKISKAMTEHRKKNPTLGEKNPFFGKKHSDDVKNKMSENKKGKWAYNLEQYEKLIEKTPKGSNHPNWNGGSSKFPYPFGFNKQLKESIKQRDSFSCKICGKNTQKLAIHHIDYNKNNIETTNLVSLCYNCHSKTNYNRKNWMVFFSGMTFCQFMVKK